MSKKNFAKKAIPISRPSPEEAMEAVKTLLAFAGDDPSREGLVETPKRVIKAYGEFLLATMKILKKSYLKLLNKLKVMMKWSSLRVFELSLIVSIIWFLY